MSPLCPSLESGVQKKEATIPQGTWTPIDTSSFSGEKENKSLTFSGHLCYRSRFATRHWLFKKKNQLTPSGGWRRSAFGHAYCGHAIVRRLRGGEGNRPGIRQNARGQPVKQSPRESNPSRCSDLVKAVSSACLGKLGFKLPAPYQALIDRAMACAARDLRETRIYMTKNNYKMYKGEQTAEFTEYVFYYLGYQDQRKYLNLRLRNRTEELMRLYLAEGSRLLE